jgi:EAL domain-containing protein (putative c-di-GMP-specific phosphodiesterase class I)
MATAPGLAVVAEGVETRAQVAMMRELGIGFGQGFLFSPPETPADLEARLAAYASMSGCSNARPGSPTSPRG